MLKLINQKLKAKTDKNILNNKSRVKKLSNLKISLKEKIFTKKEKSRCNYATEQQIKKSIKDILIDFFYFKSYFT